MITLRRPTEAALAALVEADRSKPLSYREGLLHRVATERGWFVDRHRKTVGHGVAEFDAACEALRQWEQFRRRWAIAAQPPAPIVQVKSRPTARSPLRKRNFESGADREALVALDEASGD